MACMRHLLPLLYPVRVAVRVPGYHREVYSHARNARLPAAAGMRIFSYDSYTDGMSANGQRTQNQALHGFVDGRPSFNAVRDRMLSNRHRPGFRAWLETGCDPLSCLAGAPSFLGAVTLVFGVMLGASLKCHLLGRARGNNLSSHLLLQTTAGETPCLSGKV